MLPVLFLNFAIGSTIGFDSGTFPTTPSSITLSLVSNFYYSFFICFLSLLTLFCYSYNLDFNHADSIFESISSYSNYLTSNFPFLTYISLVYTKSSLSLANLLIFISNYIIFVFKSPHNEFEFISDI